MDIVILRITKCKQIPSCVCYIYDGSINRPGTILLLEAKMSLRAALLISIEVLTLASV